MGEEVNPTRSTGAETASRLYSKKRLTESGPKRSEAHIAPWHESLVLATAPFPRAQRKKAEEKGASITQRSILKLPGLTGVAKGVVEVAIPEGGGGEKRGLAADCTLQAAARTDYRTHA